MNEKVLRWVINIAGAACLYTFIAIRVSPEMMNSILLHKTYPEYEDSTKYGELFLFSKVFDFKKELDPAGRKFRFSSDHASVHEAKILTFGDSNFDHSRYTIIPERLHLDFDVPVYFNRYNAPHWSNVLSILNSYNYQEETPKLVVLESAERYIHTRFYEPQKIIDSKGDQKGMAEIAKSMRDQLFNKKAEYLYTLVLKRSYFTDWLNSAFSTLKFKITGGISSMTPKYYLGEENILFYSESIDHFEYDYSEKEIETICDNIQSLAKELKQQHQMDFIFMAVPEKYTIYHHLITNEQYHDFLPRIHEGLKKRGVAYIDVYSEYMRNNKSQLYPSNDSHWNQKGLDIAYDLLVDHIEDNSKDYHYLTTR